MTAAPTISTSPRAPAPVALALVVSAALHAALFVAIARVGPLQLPRRAASVPVEIVEVPPRLAPKEPPAARVEEAPARPRPVRVPPRVVRAPESAPPPRPSVEGLPPPSAPATEVPAPAQPRIGVSMSSTTAAGAYAATVGNTAMGQPPARAPAPAEAKPYRSDHYAPPAEVSSLPVPIRVELPKSEYPPDALREGFEGAVRLRLVVDEEGSVREAIVVSDPGHGLGTAAAHAAKRWFRFRPARKDGVAVATEIPFTVEFQIQ